MPWNKSWIISLRLPQRQARQCLLSCAAGLQGQPPRRPLKHLQKGSWAFSVSSGAGSSHMLHLLKHTVPAGSGATHVSGLPDRNQM